MQAMSLSVYAVVSTHSRLKAAGLLLAQIFTLVLVSTHSRLKAAGLPSRELIAKTQVSTHSRLKAAVQRQAKKQLSDWFQHTAA